MTPYEVYMKVASTAYTRRLGWSDPPGHMNEIEPGGRKVRVRTLEVAPWLGDSSLGTVVMGKRNMSGQGPGPNRTASIDWVMDAKHAPIAEKLKGMSFGDFVRKGPHTISAEARAAATPAQLAASSAHMTRRMLGRAMWEAKTRGLKHMSGDWHGNYSVAGANLAQVAPKLVRHADVKYIEAPGATTAGQLVRGKNTPVWNLDEYFENARKYRMGAESPGRDLLERIAIRRARTTNPSQDVLTKGNIHERLKAYQRAKLPSRLSADVLTGKQALPRAALARSQEQLASKPNQTVRQAAAIGRYALTEGAVSALEKVNPSERVIAGLSQAKNLAKPVSAALGLLAGTGLVASVAGKALSRGAEHGMGATALTPRGHPWVAPALAGAGVGTALGLLGTNAVKHHQETKAATTLPAGFPALSWTGGLPADLHQLAHIRADLAAGKVVVGNPIFPHVSAHSDEAAARSAIERYRRVSPDMPFHLLVGKS